MTAKLVRYELENIGERIYTIHGQKVIADFDLAEIYGVTTKRLNEQVKRNVKRFPADFMFKLTLREWGDLRSQNPASGLSNRSQIATGSQRHRDPRFVPYVFTEHGAVMAANILKSDRAIQMSLFVVRAFVKMRRMLSDTRNLPGGWQGLKRNLRSGLMCMSLPL